MREILFRGKRLDNGEWIEGDLRHGGYYLNDPNVYICCRFADTIMNYPVDPYTIGQYTGLKDKNGKRIFEGDILSIAKKMDGMGMYYNPAIEYPVRVAVRWDMCAWLWETIAKDKRYISFPDAWCHFECEIIGNIHDNPELLEGDAHAPDVR